MASSRIDNGLPIVLVTNDDGSTAAGLVALVDVLISGAKCKVFVCAPDQERSGVSHSITSREHLLEVGPVGVTKGISGYEVSGSPADCVSLALNSDMFSWKVPPALVLSGINKGCNIGYHMFYSGTVAGAREAVIHGVPAMAISLHWVFEKGSCDDDFKAAAVAVLPLIHEMLADCIAGNFPKGVLLSVDVPLCPSSTKPKGFRMTRQGMTRPANKWTSLEYQTRRSSIYGVKEQAIASQLAQMGMAAAAVGAARRTSAGSFWASKRQNEEIEALGTGKPGKSAGGRGSSQSSSGSPANSSAATFSIDRRQFRNEVGDLNVVDTDEDTDAVALTSGWISVTPVALLSTLPRGLPDTLSRYISEAEKNPFRAPETSTEKVAVTEKSYETIVCHGDQCMMVKKQNDNQAKLGLELNKMLPGKVVTHTPPSSSLQLS